MRDGSSTKRLNIDHEINQFHEDLLKFVACRNSFDKKLTYKKLQSQILKKLNAQKKSIVQMLTIFTLFIILCITAIFF